MKALGIFEIIFTPILALAAAVWIIINTYQTFPYSSFWENSPGYVFFPSVALLFGVIGFVHGMMLIETARKDRESTSGQPPRVR